MTTTRAGLEWKNAGLVKKMWLHIAKEGGRWTPEEIAIALGENKEVVNRALHSMAGRRRCLSKIAIKGKPKFGVTEDCVIPRGITVKEMAEIEVVRLVGEEKQSAPIATRWAPMPLAAG